MAELNDVVGGDFEPEYRREGGTHAYAFEALRYELSFNRVSVSSDAIHAWIDIRSFFPGDPKRLLAGHVNVSGPRARADLARQLQDRSLQDVDWKRILEVSFVELIERLDEGSPTYSLPDVQPRQQSRFRVEPLAFEGLPVIWFGRGGSGKSLLAIATALSLQSGTDLIGLPFNPGPVLYCDWELDFQTWSEQARLLCAGAGIPLPGVRYRECTMPLHHEADAIGRMIVREGIQVVFIDSLGAACGGDKNSQEVATRAMNAIRGWGVTVVCIDHIAKAEDTNTPYGSTYFETAARATWRAKGVMEDGASEHYLVMGIEKSNLGRYPPVSFKFEFGPDASEPEMIRVMKPAELPSVLQGERANSKNLIKQAMSDAKRAMTVTDLIEATGIKEKSLRQRLAEMEKSRAVVKIIIPQAANKYALRAKEGMEWDEKGNDYVESRGESRE